MFIVQYHFNQFCMLLSGTANGELAGMALSSDPYAFDDVEDPINQPTTFSDINLKQSQCPWPTIASEHKPIKTVSLNAVKLLYFSESKLSLQVV